MQAALTAETFTKLLLCLDPDRERASEKYEHLRRTLIRFFEWRGAPFPEEHTDESFDRVARKLSDGVEIRNIGGYCYEVARLVYLETLKGPDSKRVPIEDVKLAVARTTDDSTENELRMACLDDCLHSLPGESAELILEYYGYENPGQINSRRALAEKLGLRRDALANRAQRIRVKLEECVSVCLKNKTAI